MVNSSRRNPLVEVVVERKKKRKTRSGPSKQGPSRRQSRRRSGTKARAPRRQTNRLPSHPLLDRALAHPVGAAFYRNIKPGHGSESRGYIPMGDSGSNHFIQKYFHHSIIEPRINFDAGGIAAAYFKLVPWEAVWRKSVDGEQHSTGNWLFELYNRATLSFVDHIKPTPIIPVMNYIDVSNRHDEHVLNFTNSAMPKYDGSSGSIPAPAFPLPVFGDWGLNTTDNNHLGARIIGATLSVRPVQGWNTVRAWTGCTPNTEKFAYEQALNPRPPYFGGFAATDAIFMAAGPFRSTSIARPYLETADYISQGNLQPDECVSCSFGPWNYRSAAEYARVRSPSQLIVDVSQVVDRNITNATQLENSVKSVPFIYLEWFPSSLVVPIGSAMSYALEVDVTMHVERVSSEFTLTEAEEVPFITGGTELVDYMRGHSGESRGTKHKSIKADRFTPVNHNVEDQRTEMKMDNESGWAQENWIERDTATIGKALDNLGVGGATRRIEKNIHVQAYA